MFSLARALPSPTSAEDCSSLFGWFIGTTARSDSSGACVLALWLWAFANRSRSWSDRDAPEVSRFSCMLFLSVRGFLDYAGPTDHSRPNAASHFAFLPLGTESAPCSRDRKSTRLNSSHLGISYAVFCLKKKNIQQPSLLSLWGSWSVSLTIVCGRGG